MGSLNDICADIDSIAVNFDSAQSDRYHISETQRSCMTENIPTEVAVEIVPEKPRAIETAVKSKEINDDLLLEQVQSLLMLNPFSHMQTIQTEASPSLHNHTTQPESDQYS